MTVRASGRATVEAGQGKGHLLDRPLIVSRVRRKNPKSPRIHDALSAMVEIHSPRQSDNPHSEVRLQHPIGGRR